MGSRGEVTQEFFGGGVDDGDVVVLGQYQDAGSVMLAASDADVVQAAVDAQGDSAGLVDAVGAHSLVGVDEATWVCFRSACVDHCWVAWGWAPPGCTRSKLKPLPGHWLRWLSMASNRRPALARRSVFHWAHQGCQGKFSPVPPEQSPNKTSE